MRLTHLTATVTERLDTIYVCKACMSLFLFKGDIEDHMQHMPKHEDFFSVPFKWQFVMSEPSYFLD